MTDTQIAKAIAYSGIGIGAMFPAKSLYNSGQEDRGIVNTAAHLAVGGAVGGAIGYSANYLSKDIASGIAKAISKSV